MEYEITRKKDPFNQSNSDIHKTTSTKHIIVIWKHTILAADQYIIFFCLRVLSIFFFHQKHF